MSPDPALLRYIAALNAAFAEAGFRTTLSGDPQAYKAAVAVIDHYHVYSPLDDALVDLDGEMIWIGIRDHSDRLVAVECCRLIKAPAEAGGLNQILNDRVFGRVLPVVMRRPPINLDGMLGYLGGAWTDDRLRGRGIMSLTLKLTVAHAVRLWGVDKVFGFVRGHHVGLSLSDGATGYGFSSASRIDEMFLPGEAAATTLCLVWTDEDVLQERHNQTAAFKLKPAAPKRSFWSRLFGRPIAPEK